MVSRVRQDCRRRQQQTRKLAPAEKIEVDPWTEYLGAILFLIALGIGALRPSPHISRGNSYVYRQSNQSWQVHRLRKRGRMLRSRITDAVRFRPLGYHRLPATGENRDCERSPAHSTRLLAGIVAISLRTFHPIS